MYMDSIYHGMNVMYGMRPNNDIIFSRQIGDINGDGVPDTVYLIGNRIMGESERVNNIRLVIHDGKTQKRTVIPLYPDYSTGYNPTVDLFDFTGDNVKDIFITIPFSWRIGYYYIFSFANNQIKTLLKPEQFYLLNKELDYEVTFKNNYKVDFISKKWNKNISLDISNMKDPLYQYNVYDENGILIDPNIRGKFANTAFYIPVSYNGKYGIVMLQQVFAKGNLKLGNIQSFWEYNTTKSRWDIIPVWGDGVYIQG